MKTSLCETLHIELPIIQAAMGGVGGPPLAAAVSNAGGLGMLALWTVDAETLRQEVRETRALTSEPFGVNLNLQWPQEERLAACLAEEVPIISFSGATQATLSIAPIPAEPWSSTLRPARLRRAE